MKRGIAWLVTWPWFLEVAKPVVVPPPKCWITGSWYQATPKKPSELGREPRRAQRAMCHATGHVPVLCLTQLYSVPLYDRRCYITYFLHNYRMVTLVETLVDVGSHVLMRQLPSHLQTPQNKLRLGGRGSYPQDPATHSCGDHP